MAAAMPPAGRPAGRRAVPRAASTAARARRPAGRAGRAAPGPRPRRRCRCPARRGRGRRCRRAIRPAGPAAGRAPGSRARPAWSAPREVILLRVQASVEQGAQQAGQGGAVVGREPGEQVLVGRRPRVAHLRADAAAVLRRAHADRAAVGRVGRALDQAARLRPSTTSVAERGAMRSGVGEVREPRLVRARRSRAGRAPDAARGPTGRARRPAPPHGARGAHEGSASSSEGSSVPVATLRDVDGSHIVR